MKQSQEIIFILFRVSRRFRSWLETSTRSILIIIYYHLKSVVKELANVIVIANTQTSNSHIIFMLHREHRMIRHSMSQLDCANLLAPPTVKGGWGIFHLGIAGRSQVEVLTITLYTQGWRVRNRDQVCLTSTHNINCQCRF